MRILDTLDIKGLYNCFYTSTFKFFEAILPYKYKNFKPLKIVKGLTYDDSLHLYYEADEMQQKISVNSTPTIQDVTKVTFMVAYPGEPIMKGYEYVDVVGKTLIYAKWR